MRVFMLALAWVVAGIPGLAWAHDFIVDQRCEPEIWSQYNISAFAPIGQEFTPVFSKLDAVELWITSQNGSGPANLVVRVRQGTIDGTVLGESVLTPVADGHDDVVHFDFAAPVDLSPGALHVLEVVRTEGPGAVLLSGDNQDSYAAGRPILSGAFSVPGDFWFRTGASASLPAHAPSWGSLKTRYR